MLQTYEGYWDNGRILPLSGSPIRITGQPKVLITVLNDAEKKVSKIEESKMFWAKFDRLAKDSSKEKLSVEDFPRMSIDRELISFVNEG